MPNYPMHTEDSPLAKLMLCASCMLLVVPIVHKVQAFRRQCLHRFLVDQHRASFQCCHKPRRIVEGTARVEWTTALAIPERIV